MINCSHWGLFSIVDDCDPMDLDCIEGVILFPKRAKRK